MKKYDFTGKNIIITGGTKGIGKAAALKFAEYGANIGIVARTYEDLKSASEEISKMGVKCIPLQGSVSNYDQMTKCFDEFISEVGYLDILVNNAGINNPKGIMEATVEEWKEVIDTNLTGVFICSKLAANIMSKQKEGNIINISSVQSRVGGRSSQYSASKAGVEGLTKSLAREMAKYNVRVNAVAPGGTETEIAKKHWNEATREKLIKQSLVGRIALPEEIANAIIFLASEDSSYIAGSTLHVNGGFYLN